jgi:hypothetical protein
VQHEPEFPSSRLSRSVRERSRLPTVLRHGFRPAQPSAPPLPEPGRQAAHVLLDAVAAFDEDASHSVNERPMSTATNRMAEVHAVRATLNPAGEADVAVTHLLGGAIFTTKLLIGMVAVASRRSEEQVTHEVPRIPRRRDSTQLELPASPRCRAASRRLSPIARTTGREAPGPRMWWPSSTASTLSGGAEARSAPLTSRQHLSATRAQHPVGCDEMR